VKLPKILRGAPAAGEGDQPRRRRRRPRPDAPRTIIPLAEGGAGPSALRADAPAALARDLDAARERLRRAIPPVADDC
jgi:hypothetical protein